MIKIHTSKCVKKCHRYKTIYFSTLLKSCCTTVDRECSNYIENSERIFFGKVMIW